MSRDEGPTLLQKLASYGSLVAAAVLLGGAGGFVVYGRLAVGGRRTPGEVTDWARHDWGAFYGCVVVGAALGLLLAVGWLTFSDPPRRSAGR